MTSLLGPPRSACAFLIVVIAGLALSLAVPTRAWAVICENAGLGGPGPAGGDLAQAANTACGQNADASGINSANTALGNGADAHGNSSFNTATGNGAHASG